jgi:HSP90 family molecular chaperone
MAKSIKKSSKSVKAPSGFHWMSHGDGKYKLMKHEGKFVPHKGASLVAKFEIQKLHKDG